VGLRRHEGGDRGRCSRRSAENSEECVFLRCRQDLLGFLRCTTVPFPPSNLTSYWNERKAPETGVIPISSGYTLGFGRGREERCQAQFL
jgi:hypothetical protein